MSFVGAGGIGKYVAVLGLELKRLSNRAHYLHHSFVMIRAATDSVICDSKSSSAKSMITWMMLGVGYYYAALRMVCIKHCTLSICLSHASLQFT